MTNRKDVVSGARTARERGASSRRLGHLHVFPEAEAVGGMPHLGARGLVGPGGAGMALALHHQVIELYAMRAGAVGLGLGRLLEPLPAHRGGGEIAVAMGFSDVIALGDDDLALGAFQGCLHAPPP